MNAKDELENMDEDLCMNETDIPDSVSSSIPGNNDGELNKVLDTVKSELDEKTKQCSEYLSMLQRTAAEFDNYKKRTTREKEALYSEAVSDVVASFLPIIDSIERAIQSCSGDNGQQVREGIELVNRQFRDVLKNIGVEEIKCLDECFNPQIHNAVMHVEDEAYGCNTVIEEFQKGYIYKDKVIRHSMVKVAN